MSCCFSSSSSSGEKDPPELLHSSLLGDDSRREGGNRLEIEVNAAKEAEQRAQQELRTTQQELRKTHQELRKTQQELVAMRQELKQAGQNTQQELAAMRQELDQLKEERKRYQQQPKEARGGVTQEAGAKAGKETKALEENLAAGPAFALAKEHVDKFSTDTRYFSYGDEHTFFNGLPLKREDIRRSIEQECRQNDDGLWEPEFEYVALEPARERELKDPASGEIRIKDKGHEGMTIKDFANLEIAISCRLKIVHIVVIRLYTGKLYKPWNDALRGMAASNEDPLKKEKLLQWATCIAVLYEAIIILSAATTPTTVFRGLSESWGMELPEEFFNPEKSKSGFAGGVELAFMSTTEDKQVERKFRFVIVTNSQIRHRLV
jgi:hypothetical protein